MTIKKCTGCQKILPATPQYFWREKCQPDGLKKRCKTCCFELPCMRRRPPSSNLRGKSLPDKIKRSIVVDGNGCWIWQKGISTGGYGRISHHQKSLLAHRVSYEVFKGPIAAGLQLDHLCRNRRCCNPDHLEQVTQAENLKRGINATRPTCVHGHSFSGDNLYVPPQNGINKKRGCRICIREAVKRYRAKKRMSADEIDEALRQVEAAT